MRDARSLCLVAACAIFASLGGASCSKQAAYTIPVCSENVNSSDCHCDTAGWILCDHICVNGQGDPNNCGACGTPCNGQLCSKGICKDSCDSDEQKCGNDCSNLQTDPLNCGSCGNQCSGPCVGGACQKKLKYGDCMSGQTICNNTCVDTETDVGNCGMCGKACPAGNGGCALGRCCLGFGYKTCGIECVDLQSDSLNCGSCGNDCPEKCSSGHCVPF